MFLTLEVQLILLCTALLAEMCSSGANNLFVICSIFNVVLHPVVFLIVGLSCWLIIMEFS